MKSFIEKHKLLKHPYGAIAVWFVAGFLVIMLGFGLLTGIVEGIMGVKNTIVQSAIIILGGIVLLVFFYLRYRPCFKGFGWLKNCLQKDVLICTGIFIVVDIILNIIDISQLETMGSLSFTTFISALQPAITEEITDRMLPLAAAMYIFKDRKSVAIPLIVTSVLFGATHMFNALDGADLMCTILQVFSAGAAGVFMGAVYLRTGSFLPGMLVHFIHDFMANWAYGTEPATGDVALLDIIMVVIFAVVQIVLSIFLIRGKQDRIQTVWNRIWVSEQIDTKDNSNEMERGLTDEQ